ncbi:unnamed protein product [Symbiodinium natans]|uniref:Uncharacterized protein n=1 Tax=Symbiodinium natans TaxID=878477 RepID=A0A812M060_9DINO|nr:unnamed protein product [Symbiodinium natans]
MISRSGGHSDEGDISRTVVGLAVPEAPKSTPIITVASGTVPIGRALQAVVCRAVGSKLREIRFELCFEKDPSSLCISSSSLTPHTASIQRFRKPRHSMLEPRL